MSDVEVRGERGVFGDDALTSWSMPSRYYSDPDIHAREIEAIFKHAWICAGHLCDLREPGSYFTEVIAGQPILVIRGQDGVVRAFFNVCQHRGHELLRGAGRLQSAVITCPYHAWAYGFDGSLKAARLTKDVAGFDKSDFPLRKLSIAVSAGLVFVNLDPEAEPFDVGYSGFDETVLWHLDDMPNYVRVVSYRFEIAANWKIVVDNFMEGYHIPIAHPRLSKLYDTSLDTAVHGPLYSAFHNRGNPRYEGMNIGADEPYLGWTLWPNFCMLSLPGSKNLVTLRMNPAGPQQCLERADIYAPAGEVPANLEEVRTLFADVFNQEDIALVESVQRGLNSMGFDQGRYVADSKGSWFTEAPLHKFHTRILDALG